MQKHILSALLVFSGQALMAVPLPPALEKINKEGITVLEPVTLHGNLNTKEPERTHLFKLLEGRVYAIEFGGPGAKMTLRVEGPDAKPFTLVANQQASLKPAKEGTYRFRVSSLLGTAVKYVLGVRPMSGGPALPPGVHAVGPPGLTLESALDNNDPIDKVRKQFCKTFEVRMSAGKTYTIDMMSQQIDSYLRLEDPTGRQLAQDDDSGGNFNARIIFRPQRDGDYRVITTTFARAVGSFTLRVREQ
jgi:hypothetical protein